VIPLGNDFLDELIQYSVGVKLVAFTIYSHPLVVDFTHVEGQTGAPAPDGPYQREMVVSALIRFPHAHTSDLVNVILVRQPSV